uniref:Uncharacterized protein n=1 Tax=Fundulus heteroclitus TaxID=8078 RepID=A0A146SVT5_FUNHE
MVTDLKNCTTFWIAAQHSVSLHRPVAADCQVSWLKESCCTFPLLTSQNLLYGNISSFRQTKLK